MTRQGLDIWGNPTSLLFTRGGGVEGSGWNFLIPSESGRPRPSPHLDPRGEGPLALWPRRLRSPFLQQVADPQGKRAE